MGGRRRGWIVVVEGDATISGDCYEAKTFFVPRKAAATAEGAVAIVQNVLSVRGHNGAVVDAREGLPWP
jgi:hypothetical protein